MSLESFRIEKISISQQKMVRGGDDDPINPPIGGDTVRSGTNGGNQG